MSKDNMRIWSIATSYTMFQYPDISYIIIPGNKDKLDELAIKNEKDQ